MNNKETFLKKLSDQLLEWDEHIKVLKSKSEKSSNDVKADFEKTMNELILKREELKKQIQELNKSSDEAWGVMKEGISRSADELVKSFKSAVSKFKKE